MNSKKNLHFVVVLLSHVVHTLIMNHEIVNLIFKAVSGWLLLQEFLWNELLSRSCVFNLRGLKIITVDLCSQSLMCGLVCDWTSAFQPQILYDECKNQIFSGYGSASGGWNAKVLLKCKVTLLINMPSVLMPNYFCYYLVNNDWILNWAHLLIACSIWMLSNLCGVEHSLAI